MKHQERCPCGSKKTYQDCCDRYISGKQSPKTPEALMRSRYSAYATANIDYIKKTIRGKASAAFDKKTSYEFAKKVHFLQLSVIKSYQANEKKAYVEFIAFYQMDQTIYKMHEISEFHLIDNTWYYVDGKLR